MIHCIGDSHSSVFSGKDEMMPIWPQRSLDITEYFKSYRIGPATAYQLDNKKPILNDIIFNNVNKTNDSVLFCFGEVDIRAHLIKQINLQELTKFEIVKECVDRYVNVMLHYKEQGYNIIAWGPIASWHEDKPYTTGPSYGTCLERNTITKEFNDYLLELCLKNDIKFVSIFKDMVDENLNTKHEYLDDWEGCHIHLNQKALPLIIKEFKDKTLL
jgi:hypothetical protein